MPEPSNNVVSFPTTLPQPTLEDDRRYPTSLALQGMDADPDEVADSEKVGDALGIPGGIVATSPDGYKRQLRAQLTSDFFENNEHLREYVRAHPLGAKISSDDWGQLDALSEAIKAFGQPRLGRAVGIAGALAPVEFKDILSRLEAKHPESSVEAAAKAFSENFNLDDFLNPPLSPQQQEFQSRHPAVYQALEELAKATGIPLGLDLSQRLFTGSVAAAREFIRSEVTGLTGNEGTGQSVAREAEQLMGALPFHTYGLPHGTVVEAARGLPWAIAGKPPPIRIGPESIDLAKRDAKNLGKAFDSVFSETQKTSTLPRSPESIAKFVQVELGDSTIGISADKARELYGDSQPVVGDNKLGWIPNIEAQWEAALAAGRDIEVPAKEFLARTTPEVYDVVKDGLRLTHDGLTIDEGKEPLKARDAYEEEFGKPAEPTAREPAEPVKPAPSHQVLRRAAGLEPEYAKGWEVAEPGEPEEFLDLKPVFKGRKDLGPEEMRGYDRENDVFTRGQSTVTLTGKDILPHLDFDDLPDRAKSFSQFWAEALNRLAGDTKIHIAPREEIQKIFPEASDAFQGLHWPGTGHVYLPEDLFNEPRQRANLVILHELGHSVTTDAVESFPEIKQTIRDVMDGVAAYHIDAGTPEFAEARRPYGFKNEKEFIAEGIANPRFREMLEEAPLSDALRERLNLKQPGATYWDAVRQIFKDLWEAITGKTPTDSAMDGFFQIMQEIEQGNILLERMGGMRRPGLEVSFAEIPEEQLAKSPFAQAALQGVTARNLRLYLKGLKERLDKDQAAERELEQMKAAKQATQAWHDNQPRVREEAKNDIYRRRDVAADRYLRTGELPDGTKAAKLKLDRGSIDPVFRRELPDDYLVDGGAHPDDLASAFGYQSGDQMVRDLVRLEQQREANDLTPASHVRMMVDQETQRRMDRDYGVSAQDIIDRAEDRIVDSTEQDLLINELQALAPNTPISKKDLSSYAKMLFDRLPQDTHDFAKYINAMGREGQKAETALLEGDVRTAFEAKQRQMLLMFHAKFTKDLDKTRKQAEALMKRYQQRKPPYLAESPAHVGAIQQILMKVTEPGFIKRTPEDLASQWAEFADKPLRDWVAERNDITAIYNNPDEMPTAQKMNVADWLLDPAFSKSWKEMTPPELRELVGSLRSIEKDGREEHLVEVRGEKRNKREVIDGLIERMRAAVGGQKTTPDRTSALRTIGSLILTPETWFRRLDLGNDLGPFQQIILKKVHDGQYDRLLMEKEFSTKWRDIGSFGDTRKKIENTLFLDPLTKFQTPLEMTEGHKWAVLANMGNEGQRRVLAGGYGIQDPNMIWSWLAAHGVTPEHVARAQRMGDFFSELYGRSEEMMYDLSGWPGERIPLGKVATPWGQIDEWYHPLIPDPIRHGALDPKDVMQTNGFRAPLPGAGYEKQRTGAIYPVQLNFDLIPARIKQEINNIAMRPAITDVWKIINDKDFRNNFTLYYGKEYTKQLTEWVRDSAGVNRNISGVETAIVNGVNAIRQNMVNLLIGWNIGTFAKHVPTALIYSAMEVNPKDFTKNLFDGSPLWSARAAEAHEKSAELATRRRQAKEGIYAANEELFNTLGYQSPLWSAREWATAIGAAPIATADLYFSTVLWMTKYDKMINSGATEGDAVYAANTAVRRTHGSTLISARPAVLRAHPLIQALMPFYTFFNNSLQRTYEAGWKAKLSLSGRTLPEMTKFEREKFDTGFKNLGSALGGMFLFAVVPSIIEQLVDPIPSSEDDDPIRWGAKVFTRAPLAMIPLVRDAAAFAFEGRDPSAGIIGSYARSLTPMARDVRNALSGDEWDPDPVKTIRHLNTAMGALSGLTFEQPARTGQFVYNYLNDIEDPDTIREWWRGIHKGSSKEPRR